LVPSDPAKLNVPEITMTCGEVLVRYFFRSAIVFGYLKVSVNNSPATRGDPTYTGAAFPPPVTPDAKPKGVPVTTEEIALAEILLGRAATRLVKVATKAVN